MTRRMLDSAIFKNEKFGTMPPMARLLAIGIINQADDQGRGKAHPVYLRSQVFPYDDVTAGQVSEGLAMVATNETILLYQVEGKDYYQILNWWSYQSHQYAMPSQYPKPDGWKDRIRKTLTKGVIVTCNWITTDGKPSPDTCDEQGLAIHLNDQVIVQVNNQVKVQDYVKDEDKDYHFAAAAKAWEGMGLLLNPTIKIEIEEAVDYWRDKGHPEFVAAAIVIATKANVRRWDYVQGILRRCEANGTAPDADNKPKNGSDPAKPAVTHTKPDTEEKSRRFEEAGEELIAEGVTPENDKFFYAKIEKRIEAKYGK